MREQGNCANLQKRRPTGLPEILRNQVIGALVSNRF